MLRLTNASFLLAHNLQMLVCNFTAFYKSDSVMNTKASLKNSKTTSLLP